MKDDKGLYYHPFPQNKKVRMYVRETGEGVCFRLWNSDDPKLWEEHGWIPYDAIRQASAIYKGADFNPTQAYDIEAARTLLRDNRK
jgi:hypothetical protein